MNRIIFLIVVVVALTGWGPADASNWSIDSDRSSIHFEIQNRVFPDVKGSFNGIRGNVLIDDRNLTGSEVMLVIPADGLKTGTAMWDRLLKSPGYLDAVKFPALTFLSKGIQKDENGKLKVYGVLSMRGVTREIGVEVHGLDVEDQVPGGKTRRGALALAKVNRKDFGIAWGGFLDNGGLLVGEEIEITMNLELVRRCEGTGRIAAGTPSTGTIQASLRDTPRAGTERWTCCGNTKVPSGIVEEL